MRFLFIFMLLNSFLRAQETLPIQHKQLVLLQDGYLVIENGQETKFELRTDNDVQLLFSHCSQFPEVKDLIEEITPEVKRQLNPNMFKRLRYTLLAFIGVGLAPYYINVDRKITAILNPIVLVGGYLLNRKTIKLMIKENFSPRPTQDKMEFLVFACNQAYQQQNP